MLTYERRCSYRTADEGLKFLYKNEPNNSLSPSKKRVLGKTDSNLSSNCTMQLEVRDERSAWRDDALDKLLNDKKIKTYGFLVSEYNYGKSCAMINYIPPEDGEHIETDKSIYNYCSMRARSLPYFTAIYHYELISEGREDNIVGFRIPTYTVYGHNKAAIKFLSSNFATVEDKGLAKTILSERDFITFLYKIRKMEERSIYYKQALIEAGKLLLFSQPMKREDIKPKSLISLRHRKYKWDTPCVDVDCMVCNDHGIPKFFIEFKRKDKFIIEDNNASKAIADLGDGCSVQIPVLLCCYNLNKGSFNINSGFNDAAKPYGNKTYTVNSFFELINK